MPSIHKKRKQAARRAYLKSGHATSALHARINAMQVHFDALMEQVRSDVARSKVTNDTQLAIRAIKQMADDITEFGTWYDEQDFMNSDPLPGLAAMDSDRY